MKKLTDETAASKLFDAALARFTNAHKNFAGDIGMMKVQGSDYLDLTAIANLIKDGETSRAMKKMYDLDTEVRDDIPQDVWDYCDKI